jgi:hypothetical protein
MISQGHLLRSLKLCYLRFLFVQNVFSAFVVSAQRYSAALDKPDTVPDAWTARLSSPKSNMLVLVGRWQGEVSALSAVRISLF